MGEVHFMISEAAKRVNVETHVLRYWEEELDLPIDRTEMGHRYYTEENLQLFNCIKELKEQGMLLKELKTLIPDILETKAKMKAKREVLNSETLSEPKGELLKATPEVLSEPENNLEKVQNLISDVVQNVVANNNKVLEKAVSDTVSERVLKEMDYLMQAKERQEEERYKKLDYLIRQQQTNRKEAARLTPGRRLRKLLGENI